MFKIIKRTPKPQTQVEVDQALCHHCGACVAVCPPDSIFLLDSYLQIDHATCTMCERCVKVCPVHALSIVEIAALETVCQ